MASTVSSRSLASVPIGFTILTFVLPTAMLAGYSFGLVRILPDDPGPNLDAWIDFIQSPYPALFLKSLSLAALTALICMVLAYPIAYYMAFVSAIPAARLLFLIMLPLSISLLVRILAWRILLGDFGFFYWAARTLSLRPDGQPVTGLLNNSGAVVLVLVYAWLPLSILPVYASLRMIDRRLVEAAVDQGATRWAAFVTVTLPLSAPGVLAGFVLVFIPVIGEYVTPTLVGGTRGMMYGNAVANMFGSGFDWRLGAVLASVLLLATILCIGLLILLIAGVDRMRRAQAGALLSGMGADG